VGIPNATFHVKSVSWYKKTLLRMARDPIFETCGLFPGHKFSKLVACFPLKITLTRRWSGEMKLLLLTWRGQTQQSF